MAHTEPTSSALPHEGFIRLPQVLKIFPVSKTKWYDGIAKGEYPPPVKLGPFTSAWDVKKIRKLIDDVNAAA